MKPTLLVMAAGMGSRYGDLKQIDQFGPSGETIVDYTIYDAKKVGFEKVVFVIRKSFEKEFKEKYKKIIQQTNVEFVFQELDFLPNGLSVPDGRVKPWGTGHAVWVAKEAIDEPFAVVNADDYYGRNSLKLIFDYLVSVDNEELAACLIAYQLKNTLSDHGSVSRGLCEVSGDNNLKSITEKTEIYKGADHPYYVENEKEFPLTGNEPVSMNLMGFTSQVFDQMETEFIEFYKSSLGNPKAEFYIPTVMDNIRKSGRNVPVLLTNDSWFGVTYKEDKINAQLTLQKMVADGEYPESLWN